LKRANALFNFSFEKGLTNFNLYVIIKAQSRKELIKMDVIKIYNYKTDEILEKTFSDQNEADDLETILDFIGVEYERFHNGEKWY
jgi:hypothetical protein